MMHGTMPPPSRRHRARGLAVPALLGMLGVAVLVWLGTWQLERKAWKEALIDRISQRLADAPADLPASASWPRLDRRDMEFRRVRLEAEFLNDREALVYATGSALRSDVSGVGYWVFTPARLADGAVVLVDRGFVPQGRRDPSTRAEGELRGIIGIVGVMRWSEDRGLFTPADDSAHNLWFVRDVAAIAASKRLGPVAPFYVEQESPVPPGGLPSPARMAINLPNNHLQYAITWYGLAVVLVGVLAGFVWTQWRDDRAVAAD